MILTAIALLVAAALVGAVVVTRYVTTRRRHDSDLFATQMEAALIYERHRHEDRRLERPVDSASWAAQRS